MNTQKPFSTERTTDRYRQKRTAILNVAAQLFDEYGIKGTMLSEIAGKAGLNTNSITYYFKKKEDLVLECLMHTIKTIEAIIERAAIGNTPADRVRLFVEAFVDMLAECQAGRHPSIMTFRNAGELDTSYTEIAYAAYSDMFRNTRNLLADGPLHSDNRMALTVRTHLLLTLVQWSRFWLTKLNPSSYRRMADRMSDILLNGLSGPGVSWVPNTLDRRLAAIQVPYSPNQSFLAAAISLINEVGYDGASIERISARLSVTKGSFYHHIPSKEELFAECIHRTTSLVEVMQDVVLQSDSSGFDKLRALSRALVDFQFSPRGPLLRVSAWSELSNYADFHEEVQPLREFTQNMTDIFAMGASDGSLRPVHQQVAALMMVAMITGATSLDKWVPGAEKIDVTSLYVRPLFEGICCSI